MSEKLAWCCDLKIFAGREANLHAKLLHILPVTGLDISCVVAAIYLYTMFVPLPIALHVFLDFITGSHRSLISFTAALFEKLGRFQKNANILPTGSLFSSFALYPSVQICCIQGQTAS